MLTNLAELESQARQFAIETSKEGKSLLSLLNDLKTVAGLGRIFQKLQLVQLQRDPTLETYKAIHVKQTEDLEASMEEELIPHFNRVLKDVAGKIPSVPTDITDEDKAAKIAKRITDSIFTDTTLDEYNKDLFKSSLPSLGEAFAKGATTQFESHKALGLLDGTKSGEDIDGSSSEDVSNDEGKTTPTEVKLTSAEILAQQLIEEGQEFQVIDLFNQNIDIGAPEWLVENARAELEETMSQDYWINIHGETTRNDITNLLERSLLEGVSTRNIAKSIEALGGDYSRNRAMRIARTEIPNVLNAGHNSGINQVAEETGLDIGKEWVSVLGNTTRDSHADIDGDQVKADGLFTLGGVDVPWPAHVALPPEERINCFCSIISTVLSDEIRPTEEEDEAVEFSNTEEWVSSLSDQTKADIFSWTETDFTKIRDCQRLGKCEDDILEKIKNIESAMKTAPKNKSKVFRGITFEKEEDLKSFLSDLEKGPISFSSMASSSKSASIAEEFIFQGSESITERVGKTRDVVFEIQSKSGVDISSLSKRPNEKEILLPKGIKLELIDSREDSISPDFENNLTVLRVRLKEV